MNPTRSGNLFRSIIEGDLSEEQIEELKQREKFTKQWVFNDEDSDEDIDDEDGKHGEMFEPQPGTSRMELLGITDSAEQLSHKEPAQLQEVAKSPSEKKGSLLDLQKELTNKFLDGELTFSEFTMILDRRDEENSDDIDHQEELLATSTSLSTIHGTAENVKMEVDEKKDDRNLKYADYKRYEDCEASLSKLERDQATMSRAARRTPTYMGTHKDNPETEAEVIKWRKEMKLESARVRNKLPIALRGLIGEANMTFARGDREEAIQICMEAIRLAPTCPEPFQTLGMIYEDMGETEKSLQFVIISAYLSSSNTDQWTKLAEMSLERGDIKQAITCYTKVIRLRPTDTTVMSTRLRLYEQLGDEYRTLQQMQQLLRHMGPEQGEEGFQIARYLAKALYGNNLTAAATANMELAFKNHQNYITSEDVNLLLELLIKQKLYAKCIRVLYDHCGVQFDVPLAEADQDDLTSIEEHIVTAKSCTVPDQLPVDLHAKLMISLINLGGSHLLKDITGRLLQENLDDMGDLYLDVAEAYMGVDMYQEAIPLLAALAISDKFNLAAVWLRYAECYSGLGQLEMAVRAYRQVIEHAPCHISARIALAGLLQQLDRSDEALDILKFEDGDGNVALEPKLLLHRCSLLYSRGLYEEFIEVAKQLHDLHFCGARSEEYTRFRSVRRIQEVVKEYKESLTDQDGAAELDSSAFGDPEDLWDNYLKLIDKLHELRRFEELEQTTKASLTSKFFSEDPEKLQECEFHRMLACYFNRNFPHAYSFIRHYIFKDINSNRAWNMFNQIIGMIQDLRHTRFILRLMVKNQDHIPLLLINGHTALVSGSYKHALVEYMNIFKRTLTDPLINLCIGLAHVHLICQKYSGKKNSLFIQATAFLIRYQEFRGDCQESYYNLGRAMHQMGLFYVAEHCYKKGLELEPAIPNTSDCDIFDLRREIAHNLSLIYLQSNNRDLAQMYLDQYCTV